jgi:hypothetical protein
MQIASNENVAVVHSAMSNAEPSAVAWGAIIAGAVVAVVTSLLLLMLGSGLGLVATSPWSADTGTAQALGIGAIVWLIVMQLLSAALGGFVGGRLRTRWSASADEVFFRDTAHGLLVWAVATLVTATLFAGVAASVIRGAVQAGAAASGLGAAALRTAASTQSEALKGAVTAPMAARDDLPPRSAYYADLLLRSDKPTTEPENAQLRAELGRLIAAGAAQGNASKTDSDYMAQTIAARTGMSQTEAQQRVQSVMTQAKQEAAQAQQKARAAADEARRAAAHVSLWMVVSLFVGAFVASYAGTVGGRMRDQP